MFNKRDKKKKTIHRRLYDVQANKIGIVDMGANGRTWLVVTKRGVTMKFDVDKLSKVRATLDRMIQVFKAGTPTPEVEQKLVGQVEAVNGLLKDAGFSPVVSEDVSADLASLKSRAETIGNTTGDLNIVDELDSLSKDIDSIREKLTPAKGEAETEVEGLEAKPEEDETPAVAEDVKAEETPAAAAEASTSEETPATPAADAAEAAPAEGTPAAEEAPTESASEGAADDAAASEPEVVTTDKLDARFAAFEERMSTLVTKAMTDSKHATLTDGLQTPPAADVAETQVDKSDLSSDSAEVWPADFNE